ncbi:TPA: flagellar protein FlgN [Citrobacter sedlakii]|nr:flagellar protein FlgN [Citrobacter sedlakii]EKX8507942.1 flagellar protein FlgN [Citrobacter sedlakii]HCA7077524.1 flagellar protein FlgN [Citrobacter sedlakii]HCA7081563.1 flagellar protein FlgN [Citrobacter sedlakii]HCA7134867.1 flagellar protein FlgN [Citrobacter sedlakii]
MSTRILLVKALLQGIREDDALYDTLRMLLETQRLCMIRRAGDELLAVNDTIQRRYEQLNANSQQRRTLLQQLEVSVNRSGLEQVFNWLPGPQKNAARSWWQRLEQKAERCKAYNEKNGDLLIRQYEFIQAFLGTQPDFIYQPG